MNLELRRKFMLIGNDVVSGRLPKEYQEVEYVTILNDGSVKDNGTKGYLNRVFTKLACNSFDYVEMKLVIPQKPKLYTMLFCGCDASGKVGGSAPYCYLSSGSTWSGQGGFTFSCTIEPKISYGGDPSVLTFTNVQTTYTKNLIFGGYGDSTDYSTTINWYYFKLSLGGNPIAEFIPCYRKSDNVAGFYDIVRNEFFVNDYEATRAFVAGGKV